ncbi:MAG: TIGR01777 family oxidoreductase [Nitrospira sp.]
MNIVITGGTGFIGRALCAALSRDGHHMIVLTRNSRSASSIFENNILPVEWNGRDIGPLEQALEGADAIINLAGASIAEARWTHARKRLITDSRVLTTRLLIKTLAQRSSKPTTFISASGIGYYGASDDRQLNEGSPRGQGFLADLCQAWEAEALQASQFGNRVVILRTGMVLEQDGGALPKMLLPFRLFAGGPIMPGNQWVSWIHRKDHIGLIQWALSTTTISGPINAVAPEPVTMMNFCEILGQVLHRPSWLPIPGVALNMLLGELGTLMTTGQRVIPEKAMTAGYTFQYPTLRSALQGILVPRAEASQAT